MTNPSKTRRTSSPIANSKYAPAQPPQDDRRHRLESLAHDPAEIARAKREIAQMARQQGGRPSTPIQLDDVEVQQRKPLHLVAAPEPSQSPAPPSAPQQFVEIREPLEEPATISQPPASSDRPIPKPAAAEPKQQALPVGSSSRAMFQHVEHRPVHSPAPTRSMPAAQVAYRRDEHYDADLAPIQEVYAPWETINPAARGQLFMLLLVALVCMAVIWMFLQSPKAFISAYKGLIPPAAAVLNQGRGLPSLNVDVPDGEHSVLGAPSIDAAAIDTILSKYSSPATGTGQIWVKLGQQYGIDPAYAVAFFIHESSAGTNPGWAGMKPDGTTTHNVGNIICAGYATCYNRFRDYNSWDEGIADWYELISHEYVGGRGVASVEQIIPIYAPSSDNNNVPGYINVVVSMVEGWRQGVLR
jgi:hypothetical protein